MIVSAIKSSNCTFGSNAVGHSKNSVAKKSGKTHPSGVVENIGGLAGVGLLSSVIVGVPATLSEGVKSSRALKTGAKGVVGGAALGFLAGATSYFVTDDKSKKFKKFQNFMMGATTGLTVGLFAKEILKKSKKYKNTAKYIVPVGTLAGGLLIMPLIKTERS